MARRYMLYGVLKSCRRTAVVLSVIGVLSSLLATAHVHTAGDASPTSCSACVHAAHKIGITANDTDFALTRLDAQPSLAETPALAAASLYRARGRAPPPLASLQSC